MRGFMRGGIKSLDCNEEWAVISSEVVKIDFITDCLKMVGKMSLNTILSFSVSSSLLDEGRETSGGE